MEVNKLPREAQRGASEHASAVAPRTKSKENADDAGEAWSS